MKLIYKNKKGQVLIEYLLLMVIAIGCVTILTKSLVNREDANPGLIIKAWDKMIKTIGEDIPDCVNPGCN